MKNNLRKGFTLIEMLVVVAIISILAGVVLTGVTGFQASARDTRRISELKLMQTYLEQYAQRFGHYPGTATGGNGAVATWADLRTVISGALGITIPNDPIAARSYFYATDATENLRYILGARLENRNNALESPQEIDTMPTGVTWSETSPDVDCSDAQLGYCIGS